jgi:ferritin
MLFFFGVIGMVAFMLWYVHNDLKDCQRVKQILDRNRDFLDEATIAYLDSLNWKSDTHNWKKQGF